MGALAFNPFWHFNFLFVFLFPSDDYTHMHYLIISNFTLDHSRYTNQGLCCSVLSIF